MIKFFLMQILLCLKASGTKTIKELKEQTYLTV